MPLSVLHVAFLMVVIAGCWGTSVVVFSGTVDFAMGYYSENQSFCPGEYFHYLLLVGGSIVLVFVVAIQSRIYSKAAQAWGRYALGRGCT